MPGRAANTSDSANNARQKRRTDNVMFPPVDPSRADYLLKAIGIRHAQSQSPRQTSYPGSAGALHPLRRRLVTFLPPDNCIARRRVSRPAPHPEAQEATRVVRLADPGRLL